MMTARCVAGVLMLAAGALLVTASARADVFLLKNGDRFRGGEPTLYEVGKVAWMKVETDFGTVRFKKSDLKRQLRSKNDDGPVRVESIVTTLVRGLVEKTRDGEVWTRVKWPEREPTSDVDEAHLPVNEPNRFIAPGDRVRTGEDGVLDLDVGWGVVHVAPQSEIVFEEQEGATLNVLKGRAGASLPALPPDGEFRVDTPQSSMGVRGTVFCVTVAGTTRVAVGEGTVDVGGLLLDADQAAEQAAGAGPVRDEIDPDEEALLDRTRAAFAVPRFDWVRVPGGSFVMGEKNADAGFAGVSAPWPERTVRLADFDLGRVEVTNAQYAIWLRWLEEHHDHRFCHPDEPPGHDHTPWRRMTGEELPEWFRGADVPVCGISWYSAYGFAAWSGVHLPSEAQWEYAARAGTRTRFPWGDTLAGYEEYEWLEMNLVGFAYHPWQPPPPMQTHTPEYNEWLARMRRENRAGPQPVGTRAPNRWGLHDMMGNVSEYLRDFMHLDYEGAPKDGSPWLTRDRVSDAEGERARVGRGESWVLIASDYQPVHFRGLRGPSRSEEGFGLRVMRMPRR